MALQLAQKEAIVADVHAAAAGATSALLADYRGLTVQEMTELRARARDAGVTLRVVRNTLLKRAVKGTDFECLEAAASGPTLLAFSTDEPGSAARLFKDAAAQLDALDVKAVSVGGRIYPAEDLDRVASLPTKEGALAMLMSVLLAPVTKLAVALNDVPSQLVRTLAAIGEKRGD
jgi:large subunit ribosomal protein L10